MPIIKLVNESEGYTCCGSDALFTLLDYVMDVSKTSLESRRCFTSVGTYSGCEPFIFSRLYENNAGSVFQFMDLNNNVYQSDYIDIAKHRVVSFHSSDLVLPNDLDVLGRRICEYYCRKGFIAAYGVHRDTLNYHVHIVVNTVGYLNGGKFNIYNEHNVLMSLVSHWERTYLQPKLSNPDTIERYNQVLFGDGELRYGNTALTSKGQIKQKYIRKKK